MTRTQTTLQVKGNPGRKLERARRQNKLTRQDVAQRLNIPLAAIKYLDRWELDNLNAKYKNKQVIRQYALLVGLNPADFESLIPYHQPNQYKSKPMVILSRLSLSTLAVAAGLMVIGFLGWRTFIAAAKPVLNIAKPAIGQVTNQPSITVSGQTSEQAQVYVDGFNVPVDPEGGFSTSVILSEGANTITITAINSFGRQSEAKRIVDYSP
jgi:cytoskeletal protein RodZ